MSIFPAKTFRYEIKVLSLPSAADRRARISQMLSHDHIGSWSFFDAVDADCALLPYNEFHSFITYGSVLSNAEISCAASHMKISNYPRPPLRFQAETALRIVR